jgi:hypothetical protein
MAETLGSLCDKLTIIKLKQFHVSDQVRLNSLNEQEIIIKEEIDHFAFNALNGLVPLNKLSFENNKVFKKNGNQIQKIEGNLGEVFALLAKINCDLWHAQEKVYDFEKVPAGEKNGVIKRLAVLNLERNKCIDEIDKNLIKLVIKKLKVKI